MKHPPFSANAPSFFPYRGQEYDYLVHSWLGKYSFWLSPTSYSLAFSSWFLDLAISPAKRINILNKAMIDHCQLLQYAMKNCFDKNCAVCAQSRKHDQTIVKFSGRQILDMLSPSNFILSNPEVL